MPNQEKKPWEADARLDEEALSMVGKLLLSVRRDVAEQQEPKKGDGKYGLGCRTYERFTYSIIRLAASGDYPWLSVIQSGNEFAFSINGCPMRQYRGDSENPPTKQLERAREQLSLFPELPRYDPNWFWFIVVETDVHGVGIQVVVMQANATSDTRYRWIAARATDLTSNSGSTAPASPTPIIHTTTDVPEPIVEALPISETEKKTK
jgi:hypothetical protein